MPHGWPEGDLLPVPSDEVGNRNGLAEAAR
ncbi:hypothetical protein SAZ_02265 [Streptomyces noursei ZPM]|nr:hypothetical protein SAZ_02265 [Streptomyces noursei ZPM]EPY92708.1 hypothetical protein K530_52015 [Streptomyces noursei CCRC 11814]